jgi:hypothetical protein
VIVPTVGALGNAFTVILLVDTQPVLVSVKVKVTVPAATPVTNPTLVIVAIPVLELVHVPPVLGVTFAVLPTHTDVAPPNTGRAFTTIVPVAFTVPQPPVNGIVYANVPDAVGVPLKVMVLLAHATVTPSGKPVAVPIPVAPVVVCVLLMAVPIHNVVFAIDADVLFGVTTMVPVAFTVPQPPVNGIVYANVPDAVGVPLIVIVLLAKAAVTPTGKPVAVPMPVAPVVVWVIVGVNAVLIHNVVVVPAVAVLFGVTTIIPVAFTVPHPPVNGIVYANVPDAVGVPLIVIVLLANAAVTPVGKPVAVPMPVAPVVVCVIVGDNAVLIHNVLVALLVTVLAGVTVKLLDDEHPVTVSVKVRLTLPAETPVTTPALVTVAIELLLLVHVPPVLGVTLAVLPTHTAVAPPKVIVGQLTVMIIRAVSQRFSGLHTSYNNEKVPV